MTEECSSYELDPLAGKRLIGKVKMSPLTLPNAAAADDMRILKILRRLQQENNPGAALELCSKLEVAVRSPINAAFICRSFDTLLEYMINVWEQCPAECLVKASEILGLMGYINRADFPVYKNFITKVYQTHKSLRKYTMIALKATFSCDAVNLDLEVYSERLLVVLKDYLENAEVAGNFIAVSETIAEFSKNYKHAFEAHFTDIVDITVGWHLEIEQPQHLKLHCSMVLQQFSGYFLNNIKFTSDLLMQFLEDIAAIGEEIMQSNGGDKNARSSGNKIEVRVGSFVGAFNSIIKSLATRQKFVGILMCQIILNNAVITIAKTAEQCLLATIVSAETILNINDFFCLIFSHDSVFMELINTEKLIMLQMGQFNYFDEAQKLSLLHLILCVFRQLRTNVPLSTVTLVFNTSDNPLAAIKLTKSERLQKLFLKIYQEILMIKNVPLLQEAYKHVVADIEISIATLQMYSIEEHSYELSKAESTLQFCLAALSALATQSSSIISMYALHPSILELLITNCKTVNMRIWAHHSTLHHALLSILVVHCQKNHNFRLTSRLLSEPRLPKHVLDDNISPTSENFSMILEFLAKILGNSADMNDSNLCLLLSWIKCLLMECREYAPILQNNGNFQLICKALCINALKIPLNCASAIEIICEYPSLNGEVLEYIQQVSLLLLDSVDENVKQVYTRILAKLPLVLSLNEVSELKGSKTLFERKRQLSDLQQWYKATAHFAPLRGKYFKSFLEKLENGKPQDQALTDEFISSVFVKCWIGRCRENALEYQKTARDSSVMLAFWLQYEAARQCVRNKLRTLIGKPQETFLGIEAIITKYARALSVKGNGHGTELTLRELVSTQRCIRMLLGFLEYLEKHIYNAAEGTAFAIPAVEKPAKSFFRINTNTCSEWLNRIRPGVNLIAMHSAHPEMVVRNAENMLKADKLTDNHMDHIVVFLAWALLNCGEPCALQGLYVWLKSKSGSKRYTWVQYVAEQAAGHREQAAEAYHTFLAEHEGKLDIRIREFLIDQMLHCWYYSAQWSKMRTYSDQLKLPSPQDNLQLLNGRSNAHLFLMEGIVKEFEERANESQALNEAIMELTQWPEQVNHSKNHSTTFSFYNIIPQLEANCVAHLLNTEAAHGAPQVQAALQLAVQEANIHLQSPRHNAQLKDLYILNNVYQKITDRHNDKITQKLCTPDEYREEEESSSGQLKILLWSLMLQHNAPGTELGPQQMHYNAMYLDIATTARREGNLLLCQSMLKRFFTLKGFTRSLQEISSQMVNHNFMVNLDDADLLRGFSELTKCQYVNLPNQLESINLAASFCTQLINEVKESPSKNYQDASADMLLTLADWLSQRGTPTSGVMNSPKLQLLLQHLPDLVLNSSESHEHFEALIPQTEKAVGKLINGSIAQRAHSAEGWYAFGNWCYRWGKRVMEAKNTENKSIKGNLSQRDIAAIKDILGGNVNDDFINQLSNTLNAHLLSVNDADAEEEIEKNEINSMEVLESALRKIKFLEERPFEQISKIIQIWRRENRSVYAYYEMATTAYFKYLSLESTQEFKAGNNCTIGDCTSVTTTLRLLRLIVKHAAGLQDVFEEGLRTTPLRPWKVIIPQLFSRLNHHEPYVRKSVSDLLCRLAHDRPHLIIFPAVVGAHQESVGDSPQHHKESDNGKTNHTNKPSTLSTCFSTLLHTLSKQAPETVQHVQLLVKELKRVTLLWEEYWLHALSQLYSEYAALFNALEAEWKKCGEPQQEKIAAKYAILTKHVAIDFQKISLVTEKNAETVYERNFQERYNTPILNTLSELKNPFNVAKPFEGWLRIKQLYNVFQQRYMRGYASSLKISDLSPVLANMRNTAISMPGVDTFEKHAIFIKSVDSTVHILPTKTKPKKLAFYGSDGRRYTYLFKGLEDLHLDERIMQFLSISNSMMARAGDSLCSTNNFKAHHYSVIPLGPQSGLISWVDGVTPLFAIYKKWQQRDAALKQQQKERQTVQDNASQSLVPAAIRPSELFYSKLGPLLAEHGLKVTDSRKQWPLSVLRKVLEELMKDTPKDLLSKELWCHALNAADWRQSVRNYSISMAVMSVIGYVIGLGDRHLDNVLIKLGTGEIVHIDYNVCFEKGKTLRVPEKVPFRMTPNLENALGLTGIEGTFRLGCEHVLKILRKERETLLTLLEAFVYDPLVDWTISDDGTSNVTSTTSAHAAALELSSLDQATNASSKDNNTVAKFAGIGDGPDSSRQSMEMKLNELMHEWSNFKWLSYRNEVQRKVENMQTGIQWLITTQQDTKREEQKRDSLMKQLAMIKELEALGSARGSHALNTITHRYEAYKRDMEAFNDIKKSVQEYQNDTQHLLEIYFDKLLVVGQENELKILQRQLEQEQCEGVNEFAIVQGLLEQRSELDLYMKGDFVRKEMNNTIGQVSWCMTECLKQLQNCIYLMQFYPRSRLHQNRLLKYDSGYRQLLSGERTAVQLKGELEMCIEDDLKQDETSKLWALQYAEALKMSCVELSSEFHTISNEQAGHRQQMLISLDSAIEEVQIFISLDSERHMPLLQSSLLDLLNNTTESFLLYEESAQDCDELLGQQLHFIEMCHQLCRIVFPLVDEQAFEAIKVLENTLQALHMIKSAFELSLVPGLVRLFMLDDNPQLQEALLAICSSPEGVFKLTDAQSSDEVNDELHSILSEIRGLFHNFEERLKQLDEVILSALNGPWHAKFKMPVEKKFKEHSLNFPRYALKCKFIAEVFRAARDSVESLKSNDLQRVYDIRAICAPLREYINQLELSTLDGMPSFFAHILHCNVAALTPPKEVFLCVDQSLMLNASALCQNLLLCLQQAGVEQTLQQQILKYSNWTDHQTCIAKAHLWTNDRHLRDVPAMYDFSIGEILKCSLSFIDSLNASKAAMLRIHDEAQQYQLLVSQHLNLNVNGSLALLKENFVERVNEQENRYHFYIHSIEKINDYVQTLLRFELHFQGDVGDKLFSVVLQQWQDACERRQLSGAMITPVEEAIVQLLDPEGKVDQCWIENISGLLDEMTFSVQRGLVEIEDKEQSVVDGLIEHVQQLQDIIDSPTRELRQLLKQIYKFDKNIHTEVRELQNTLKVVSSIPSELHSSLMSRKNAVALKNGISNLLNAIEYAHLSFTKIIQKFTENEAGPSALGSTHVGDSRKIKNEMSGINNSVSTFNQIDKRGLTIINPGEQKRNAYAVSVWKRVRMKLEGRDPDANRRCSVAEQVDFIIREALNADNLAVLYEGWTPWV